VGNNSNSRLGLSEPGDDRGAAIGRSVVDKDNFGFDGTEINVDDPSHDLVNRGPFVEARDDYAQFGHLVRTFVPRWFAVVNLGSTSSLAQRFLADLRLAGRGLATSILG